MTKKSRYQILIDVSKELFSIRDVPAKIPRTFKLWLFVIAAIFIVLTMFSDFIIRPYVYEAKLYDYYWIVDSLPSFTSVVVCYYGALLYIVSKNKVPNTKRFVLIIMTVVLSSIFYECFLSSTFDYNDLIAILAGGLFIFLIETVGARMRWVYYCYK